MMFTVSIKAVSRISDAMTKAAKGKSLAWRTEFNAYFDSACKGSNDDWALFDADASASALLSMWKDHDDERPDEYRDSVLTTMILLMVSAAKRHTNQCEKNGTLPEGKE